MSFLKKIFIIIFLILSSIGHIYTFVDLKRDFYYAINWLSLLNSNNDKKTKNTHFIGDKNNCGRLSYENGDFYIGFYKKGKRKGSGYSYYKKSNLYQYRYYHATFDNPETIQFKQNTTPSELFNIKGLPPFNYLGRTKKHFNGVGVMLFTNGTLYLGEFKNNKRHGKGCSFYLKTGKVVPRLYKKGRKISP